MSILTWLKEAESSSQASDEVDEADTCIGYESSTTTRGASSSIEQPLPVAPKIWIKPVRSRWRSLLDPRSYFSGGNFYSAARLRHVDGAYEVEGFGDGVVRAARVHNRRRLALQLECELPGGGIRFFRARCLTDDVFYALIGSCGASLVRL